MYVNHLSWPYSLPKISPNKNSYPDTRDAELDPKQYLVQVGCGVVCGVPCFWGCWLIHWYRGMNALWTSVLLVKLLILSTDPIHPFIVLDQVFQKWRYCYTFISERMSKGTRTVVSLHCMHVRNGTTHPVKWAACSLGMVLGMVISAIKISVCDDWGLFKDKLEIRGGKVPRLTRCYPDQNYRGHCVTY